MLKELLKGTKISVNTEEQTITTPGVGLLYGDNIFAHMTKLTFSDLDYVLGDSFHVNEDGTIQVMGTTNCLDLVDFTGLCASQSQHPEEDGIGPTYLIKDVDLERTSKDLKKAFEIVFKSRQMTFFSESRAFGIDIEDSEFTVCPVASGASLVIREDPNDSNYIEFCFRDTNLNTVNRSLLGLKLKTKFSKEEFWSDDFSSRYPGMSAFKKCVVASIIYFESRGIPKDLISYVAIDCEMALDIDFDRLKDYSTFIGVSSAYKNVFDISEGKERGFGICYTLAAPERLNPMCMEGLCWSALRLLDDERYTEVLTHPEVTNREANAIYDKIVGLFYIDDVSQQDESYEDEAAMASYDQVNLPLGEKLPDGLDTLLTFDTLKTLDRLRVEEGESKNNYNYLKNEVLELERVSNAIEEGDWLLGYMVVR